jgi:hypothetical protein
MPYEMRQENGLLKIAFFGTLTNDDLARGAQEIAAFEATCDVVPHRLSDVRSVERLEIDFRSILSFAEDRKRRRFPNPFKSAVVASDIVHYGFARMFQTLNDHAQITIAIFGDDATALQWLHVSGLQAPEKPWEPRMLPGASTAGPSTDAADR